MKGLVLAAGAVVMAALGPIGDAAAKPPGGHMPAPAPVIGILTFDGALPTRETVDDLRRLGLDVQPARRLPLAFVRGSEQSIELAVRDGLAARFFADEPLVPAAAASNAAFGADDLHARGLIGEGVTVAVVDTGVDATHPDLAGRVAHNVEIVGPENAELPHDTPPGNLVLAFDEGPYSNTDAGDGHGTMVAGVIAGDGTTDPRLLGVAPGAELIGYGAGPALWVRTVVAAYDHILDHPEWGIDVVNNSFGGTSWRPFDPAHPVHLATRALTDAGISVVFAAGNSGEGEAPMTLSTLSVAPWVVSVGASTVTGERGSFSSNGLVEDNAEPVALANGHARFEGDRIGLYHPTIIAPGQDIETTCTPTGAVYTVLAGACSADGTVTTFGTSLASPQVAGLLALLEQARPELGPADAKRLLEATARTTVPTTPLWQSGYGIVDAEAAYALVQHPDFADALTAAHEQATERVRADRPWHVAFSEHWSWAIPPASASGVPDTRELALDVTEGTDALRVTANSATNVSSTVRLESYRVTVLDADGRVVGVTEQVHGFVATALVDLRGRDVAFGRWTLRVEGRLAVSDDQRAAWPITVVATALEAANAPPPSPILLGTGRILAGDSRVPVGVTRTDFGASCSADLHANGVDGWVTAIPEQFATEETTLTVRSSGVGTPDLDVHFYDSNCVSIASDVDTGPTGSETATIPHGAAYVLTMAKSNAPVDLQLLVSPTS